MHLLKLFVALACITVMTYGASQMIIIKESANNTDYSKFFITTEKQIDLLVDSSKKSIDAYAKEIESHSNDAIISFHATFVIFDKLYEIYSTSSSTLYTYLYVGNNKNLIEKAQSALHEFEIWFLQAIMMRPSLYQVLKKCFEQSKNSLDEDQKRFAEDVIDDFVKSGNELSEENRKNFLSIQSELSLLGLQFQANIQSCTRGVWISQDKLNGLSESFISNLKKNESHDVFLGVDYPTYTYVMTECRNAETRNSLFKEFIQRAYPENSDILNKIRSLRSDSAQLLGYATYADYDCSRTMAKKVKTIREFCDSIDEMTHPLALKEKAKCLSSISDDTRLCLLDPHSNEITSSDVSFIINKYEKSTYNIDHEKIKEYFPVTHTLEKLLDLYSKFFGVSMKKRSEKEGWLWSEDLSVLDIMDNSGEILGTIVLDLYPRELKYTHACHCTISNTHKRDGKRIPSLAVVIANFPRPVDGHDGLLRHDDVVTFFHEFGHALHAVFGSTKYCYHSGTSTRIDFVEVPSQMLEQWMWNPEIIKQIGCHYLTGEFITDEMIKNLCSSKKSLLALHFQRQIMLSRYSLDLFSCDDDATDLKLACSKDTIRMVNKWDKDDHFECSFGHLAGYASRYYSYLWSLVYALDLFEYIHEKGLKNSSIGKRFCNDVLAAGGSRDPFDLMTHFLGRKPSPHSLKKFIEK